MLSGIILGALSEAALDYVGSRGFAFLKSREAKEEIAELGAQAIEAGILHVPALAEHLRSESFAKNVFAPFLEALISDPSQLPDPERLADEYVATFVERFAGASGRDATLRRIFQTDPSELNVAFVAILVELRSLLYKSKHWRDLAHFTAAEMTLQNTQEIKAILRRQSRAREIDAIDLEVARLDAKMGSDELRCWPRSILGRELYRPELDRLKSRVLAEASGATLLIGEAGSGKSALLSKLTEELEDGDVTVFGIKADTLPAGIATFEDVARSLGMQGSLDAELSALARATPVVLIIDQLDAVSDVMDRTTQRMQVLLRLVRYISDHSLPVHVVVSSRPFEAAHDARFQRLSAEEFELALPSVEDVQDFLSTLDVDCRGVAQRFKETLRRPFALKLFVDLVQRGVPPNSVDSGSLLDRWVTTAELGTDDQRQDVLRLMERLASEMLATETLWRPIDVYQGIAKDALARAEACGLIVRSGSKIGFCHQSWLDDFQAKSFTTGNDLAEYAWLNQDSLFLRATVLRALERLREVDPSAYKRAVSALLWNEQTRRHLKHLVADVISTSFSPSAQDGAWVEALIRDDPILANRILGKVAEYWPKWRPMLKKCLPILMASNEFHWRAAQALAGEAKLDADHVVMLLKEHWHKPERDGLVFRVAEQSGVITPAVEALLSEILNRTPIDPYAVSHFVTGLLAGGRFREACRIVALWFGAQEIDRNKNPSLYAVEKLAQEAPREFVEELLPHFLACAAKIIEPYPVGIKRFSKSQSLPWDWDFDRDRDNIFDAFRGAMNSLACDDPVAASAVIKTIEGFHIDQVQEVAAQAYTAGGAPMAREACEFLLADERRFYIGDARVSPEPGVSTVESGLTSRELIEVIAPYLGDDEIAELRDRIESWSLYDSNFGRDDEPTWRLQRLKWADEHRMALLDRLPDRFLTPRRNRQVKEWRSFEKLPVSRSRGRSMATFVGSPMSSENMKHARDEDIFGILDEINDQAPERSRRRPISMDGGVIQLSRAFGAFGKDDPARAVALAQNKFVAGSHEHAAAELVDALSQVEDFPSQQLLDLIHELTERGFSSNTWKTQASWALARLAEKLSGLPDRTVAMLGSWLQNEPAVIASKIEQRIALDAENARRNARERVAPEALLFNSYRLGGMRMVPQDNYSVLDAIFRGLIGREERAYEQWIAILERHAERDEDPHIWSFLLLCEGNWLYWADRDRVQALLRRLWDRDQRVFLNVDLVGMLWSNRGMFTDELIISVISTWFRADEEDFRQAAAELTEAFRLVKPESNVTMALETFLLDDPSPVLTGRLFTAGSAWRDGDPALRKSAHELLMKFVAGAAAGDQAHAIASAVARRDTLLPDKLTRELILEIAGNENALAASLRGGFADALQSLLLYPGFDEPVMFVTERIAELIIEKKGGKHREFIDKDFVQVAIALQHSDGPLRVRAMDVYEKLLDAGAYGAEEAAEDALGR